MTQARIFGIAGWKNSGKTGLAVRLVAELVARGYRVSTVKHAHHDFDIDRVGADSYRHRQAGAHEVALVSGTRYAVMHELRGAPEPSFEDILARLAPCDLVLVEGYKREPIPKIEARRLDAASRAPLAPQNPCIVAVAADHPVTDTALPVFDLDDTVTIADFVVAVSGLAVPACAGTEEAAGVAWVLGSSPRKTQDERFGEQTDGTACRIVQRRETVSSPPSSSGSTRGPRRHPRYQRKRPQDIPRGLSLS